MFGKDHLELFKSASAQWLCDPYSVEIRYIAQKNNDAYRLLACNVIFWPIGSAPSSSLRIQADQLIFGRELLTDLPLNDLNVFLEDLERGKLVLNNLIANLEASDDLSYFTEMISNDRWFCDAHLLIRGKAHDPISGVEIAKIDSELRRHNPPFDGLNDLMSYLNLPNTFSSHQQSQIEIRISPPIDMRLNESSLSNGKFNLFLHAHPRFDIQNTSLAVRLFPESLATRNQVASRIKWKAKATVQVGRLQISTKNSFAVQAILIAGPNTVRRQYFDDVLKVPNRRFFAISSFDKDLKRLKIALNDNDQDNFEKAVNSLAYILGFSGCVINETDAPDIILSTPNENLVIIECTTRIRDFPTKLGKLVDRKNSLLGLLKNAGDSRKVYSYLVCGLPKNQIAYSEKDLARHRVMLLTKESLDPLFDLIKFPQDLEKLLLDDEKYLEDLLLEETRI